MPLAASEIFNRDKVLRASRSSIFLTLRTKVDDFPNAAKGFGVLSSQTSICTENAPEFSSSKSCFWHVSCPILAMRILTD
jgi:hypothetical protein